MFNSPKYKISTYFYWFIIICLRLIFTIEFYILRVFRWPILEIMKLIFLKKFQIKVFFEDEEEQTFVNTNSRPILNLRFKDKNLVLRLIVEGRLPFVEGILYKQIEAKSLEDIAGRILQDALVSYNPLFKLQDWIYLNASEFPWDDSGIPKDEDWSPSETKSIIYKIMGGEEELNCVSGYWDQDNLTIKEAIARNMKRIGEKLDLKPGMKVLDLGCGIGIFANFLAENYSVNVIGINFCKEEVDRADTSNPNVEILQGDYRVLLENKKYHEYFDRVVSIHLLEHLGGPKYHSEYFNSINQYLKPGIGKLFIQTLVFNRPLVPRVDLYSRKYVASRITISYTNEILDGMARGNLFVSTIESTGDHYSRTAAEYKRIIETIKEDSLGKSVLEFGHGVGMVGFRFGVLDVWQVTGLKRSGRDIGLKKLN